LFAISRVISLISTLVEKGTTLVIASAISFPLVPFIKAAMLPFLPLASLFYNIV